MNNTTFYIDERSALAVELNFYDPGKNILDPQSTEFKIVYKDRRKTAFVIEHQLAKNGEDELFTNCYLEGGKMFARFQQTGFTTGGLERELWLKEPVKPEEGEGFHSDKMTCVLVQPSSIEVIRGKMEPCKTHHKNCSIIPLENIVFPSVKYTGITADQSQIIVNDIIRNKQKIVKAISNKGGKADIADSMEELAHKIRELEPAKPVFKTSGSMSPYWTDLMEKIGRHYREDRKYAWAFSFSNQINKVELKGADYYICSDGFETNTAQTHIFDVNPDKQKEDNWIILYAENPTYVFEEAVAPFVIGAVFYNTTSEGVYFYGTKVSFITQSGTTIKTSVTLPENYARSTGISSYIIPDYLEEVNIGPYAFDTCYGLREIRFPKTVRDITFGNYACNSVSVFPIINNTRYPDLENITLGTYALSNMESRSDEELTVESNELINIIGNNSFSYLLCKKLSLKSKNIFFVGNISSLVAGSKIKEVHILADEYLNLGRYYTFVSNDVNKIYLKSPAIDFAMSVNNFFNFQGTVIELGNDWSYSINLLYASNQSLDSMIQNCEVLANRTGLSTLTYTIGAAKLTALIQERPDIIELVQSKNWNIA